MWGTTSHPLGWLLLKKETQKPHKISRTRRQMMMMMMWRDWRPCALEWVKVAQSCLTLWKSMAYTVHGILQARILEWLAFPFSRGSSQPRSNPGLLHCRPILYQLSHKGSPRILEWVAYPFSSRSSRPKNWAEVSWIAGRFFTNWTIREVGGKVKWYIHRGKQYGSSSKNYVVQQFLKRWRDICTPIPIATLFIIAKIWK